MKSIIQCVFFVSQFLFLNACKSSETHNLNRYIADVKHRQSKLVFEMPAWNHTIKYPTIKNIKRKSPFNKMNVGDELHYALQRYPLDALHLVGIIKQGSTFLGLISQPTGQINVVKTNDVIGNKKDRVLRITDHSIEIEEVGTKDTFQKKIVVLHIR